MGKGGKGKSKKSVDWYEIKLIVQLPPEDRLHESGTGMSKQNIYDFFSGSRQKTWYDRTRWIRGLWRSV